MNKTQKILVSMLVLAILTLSSGAVILQAMATSYPLVNTNNGFITGLVTPGTLTVWGSSTVGPIATEEAATTQGNFPAYFNSLGLGSTLSTTNGVSLSTLGSGTAIPSLIAGTASGVATGPADVGEMSRPPSAGAEWTDLPFMQQYCIGLDSVAIVLSPDMTWFNGVLQENGVTGLTTLQVAQLFAETNPVSTASEGNTGATGSTALYTTWSAFFTAQGWTVNSTYSTDASATINRAVRDATSGTFDCFDNYFAVPNNYQFEYKVNGTAEDAQEMAPYTECPQNIDVYTTVHGGTNTIGFISLGYLTSYGGMIGLNIAYNQYNVPNSYIAYQSGNYKWSGFVAPTEANVEWAYTANSGGASVPAPVGATGQYQAWRWLWEVVPGLIPSTGAALADGVWIAYMMEDGTTLNDQAHAGNSSVPATGNSGSFVTDNNYIQLNRDDFTGAQVVNSALSTSAVPTDANQTQSYPGGIVNFNDITYFVTAYIAYFNQGIYNPYIDFSASGTINFNDVTSFVSTYIAYYATTYG